MAMLGKRYEAVEADYAAVGLARGAQSEAALGVPQGSMNRAAPPFPTLVRVVARQRHAIERQDKLASVAEGVLARLVGRPPPDTADAGPAEAEPDGICGAMDKGLDALAHHSDRLEEALARVLSRLG